MKNSVHGTEYELALLKVNDHNHPNIYLCISSSLVHFSSPICVNSLKYSDVLIKWLDTLFKNLIPTYLHYILH